MPPSEGKPDARPRNKIMHAAPRIGSMTLMGSDDGPQQPATLGNNISLCLCPSDAVEAKRIFKALSAKGQTTMPLAKTFWAELYGTVTDRFGIAWMVNCMGDTCK